MHYREQEAAKYRELANRKSAELSMLQAATSARPAMQLLISLQKEGVGSLFLARI